LTARDAYTLLRNSLEASFVDDEDKGLWIEELETVFAANEP
jgi:adenosine deaminase